jgi:hypothetical protein
MRNSTPTMPVWACIDCYMLHCNGETDPDMSEEETEEFLARYARGTEGMEVTAGMLREYHECLDDDGQTANDQGNECYCEERTFSWQACGICDSNLGGSRHALTLWIPINV